VITARTSREALIGNLTQLAHLSFQQHRNVLKNSTRSKQSNKSNFIVPFPDLSIHFSLKQSLAALYRYQAGKPASKQDSFR